MDVLNKVSEVSLVSGLWLHGWCFTLVVAPVPAPTAPNSVAFTAPTALAVSLALECPMFSSFSPLQ